MLLVIILLDLDKRLICINNEMKGMYVSTDWYYGLPGNMNEKKNPDNDQTLQGQTERHGRVVNLTVRVMEVACSNISPETGYSY
jgi:hypothetical protein